MNWLPKSANLEYGIVVPLSTPPAVWNVICLSLVAGVKVLFVLKYKVSNLGVVLLGSNNPKEFWEIKILEKETIYSFYRETHKELLIKTHS